jgi:predicted RNA-binding protein YlqC (UPF0109 family)
VSDQRDVSEVGEVDDLDDDADLDDEDADFEDDDDEVDDYNRVIGAVPHDVLEYLAKAIVDDPDGVSIEVSERRGGVMLSLHVAPGDMGKVIGRRGRIAQSIRAIVRAAGASEGVDASVDIVD